MVILCSTSKPIITCLLPVRPLNIFAITQFVNQIIDQKAVAINMARSVYARRFMTNIDFCSTSAANIFLLNVSHYASDR